MRLEPYRLAIAAILTFVACVARAAPDSLAIPVIEADGALRTIPARLCRPPGDVPARLVVINHGSPGTDPPARARYDLLSCTHEVARWFAARGYAVLAPLRRGYGSDPGPWAETFGSCDSPDYVRAGRETARDIMAAVAFARTLPGVRSDGIAVLGQSAGGWGALALAADPPAGVTAIINIAGGRGGQRGNRPNDNCRPDRLIAAAATLARGRRHVPALWIYSANDSFFDPDLARAMHAATLLAGGEAVLQQVSAWGEDGHSLFYGRGGSAVWGPIVEAFLAANP